MTLQETMVEPENTNVSIFERNLNALRKNNAALAEKIASLDADADDPDYPGWRFVVREARNSHPTMFAVNDETEVALHSTYDPEREASDQVRGIIGDGKRNYYVILGFGLGYAAEILLGETNSQTNLLVIEPHIGAFRVTLATRDLTSILTDPRLVITLESRVEDALIAFMTRYRLDTCTGVGFIELTGRTRLPSNKFFSALLERLKGVLITTGGNLQTLMLMAWQYQKNTMLSLGRVVDSPPVRTMFGAFINKPAIIVSAGPSLSKNIDQIKELKDRAVIIAVDTSLRPLLAAGIEPHLVCTGDPQEANWRHLRGTETHEACLVAEPMTYPSSLEHFEGRLFIASYADKVMQWICRFIPDVGHVLTWGSVATMAFDLARKMGCDPIIFVGQDLSFPGGRTYVEGTYFEDEEKMDMSVDTFEKGHTTYSLTDIFGEPVKTNRQMFAYKEWFRTEFSRTDANVINSTEGGILKENCEVMPLGEAAEKFLTEKFDALEIIRAAGADFKGYSLDPLLKGLFDNIASIKRCIDYCESGVSRIRESLKMIEKMDNLSQAWSAEVIAELDQLRFKLMSEQSMKDFLETANQTGVLNFHRAYRKVHGKQFSRVVFSEALDLFTDLFLSTGRTGRGVLPFFVHGFKKLSERSDAGSINPEVICQTKM